MICDENSRRRLQNDAIRRESRERMGRKEEGKRNVNLAGYCSVAGPRKQYVNAPTCDSFGEAESRRSSFDVSSHTV